MKDYIASLQQAIRDLHGCESTHVETTPVVERFQGKVVWEGDVDTFDLRDHPTALRCYAWGYEGEDGKNYYTAVLRTPPVDSPQDAVKAALVAQVKNENKEA
jgi:hypothetical protein